MSRSTEKKTGSGDAKNAGGELRKKVTLYSTPSQGRALKVYAAQQ